jgi:hypothetical protein
MANEQQDQEDAARRSRDAEIADESAALRPGGNDPVPTEDKPEEAESSGYPS